jgi:hypothetical protein
MHIKDTAIFTAGDLGALLMPPATVKAGQEVAWFCALPDLD